MSIPGGSRTRGYSLLEATLVVGLTMVVSTMATVKLLPSREITAADGAVGIIANQLRLARQIAVSQNRDVAVEFVAPDRLRISRIESGGGSTVLAERQLPNGFSFSIPPGAPDTPDAFGNTAAIKLGDGTTGTFRPNGRFVDAGGSVLNGSVFLQKQSTISARAVTLAGSTGRVRQYGYDGAVWFLK